MSDRRAILQGDTALKAPGEVMRFVTDICRVDAEQRMVWGYLATITKATDGLTLTIDAIRDGFAEWWQWGNVREMHQPVAVGAVQQGTEVVDEKGAYGGVKVVDDAAWAKVAAGVYKAFSARFLVLARDALNATIVTKIKVIEVSLVDIPADPTCAFAVFRSADFSAEEPDPMSKPAAASAAQPTEAEAVAAVAVATEESARGEGGEPAVTDPAPAAVEEPKPAAVAADDPLSDSARSAHANAMAALDRIEQSRGIAGVADVSRSMYTVRALSSLLGDLAWLIQDTAWEAAIDGEGSGVPDQLRAGLKTIGEAFKALSKQETDQLIANAGGGVKRGLEFAVAQGGDAALTDDEKAEVQRALDGFAKRGFTMPTPAPAADATPTEDVQRLMGQVAELTNTVKERDEQMLEISRRLDRIAAEPAPPKTAASASVVAVDKTADAAGATGAAPAAATHSAEDVQRALDAMEPAERANLLMRATLMSPNPALARVVGVAPN